MSFSKLKGVEHIGNALISDQLADNLVAFFDWGLLGVGGFFNVERNQSGVYGGNLSNLRLSDDIYYSQGQVWEGFRANWVWESGVEYNYQPIKISGVYVNGTFYSSSASGAYEYSIDYPLGRVVFSNPISVNSTVSLSYSYKYYNFYKSDVPWFRNIVFDSFRNDDVYFQQYGSGVWNTLAQNRVQLPAVIVEPVPDRDFDGMQLGGGQWMHTDVLFHIFAESPSDRNTIFDVITYQNRKKLVLYDKNRMADDNRFPLTVGGSIASGALTYPLLISSDNYGWKTAFIEKMSGQTLTNIIPNLYMAVVRATFEIEFPEI